MRIVLPLMLLAASAGAPSAAALLPVPPSWSPAQDRVLARLLPAAAAASSAATAELLAELNASSFRSALRHRLEGTGFEELAAAPAGVLLGRLRAECSASEIVHNLAIWTPNQTACGPACTGWSDGNCLGMPRTPAFTRPQLDNLWLLGRLGFETPDDVRGWMSLPDTFEVGDIGCDAFTGTLPTPPHRRPLRSPLPGDDGPCGTHAECVIIQSLFNEACGPDRSVINRTVALTEHGYIASTTSKNATVAGWLQVHVEAMRLRVLQMRPMNTWDGFYASIFNHSTDIHIDAMNVSRGVVVNETGATPCAIDLLHEHAGEVSRFVTRGMAEMAGPAHAVPKSCPFSRNHRTGLPNPHLEHRDTLGDYLGDTNPLAPWPATDAEAAERPIYGVLDLKKIDGGAIDFGPVGIVFNRTRMDARVILMPADTGQWSGSCNLTNQGLRCPGHPNATACRDDLRCRWTSPVLPPSPSPSSSVSTPASSSSSSSPPSLSPPFHMHTSHAHAHAHAPSPSPQCVSAAGNCCISKAGTAATPGSTGCDRCRDEPACCQDDKSYNCSQWDGTPGLVGHLDHVLLASSRMWNDTTTKKLHYTPSTNLADLLSRSVAAAGDYGGRHAPELQPHNNYYVEANLLATPQFRRSDAAGSDVLFVIGAFPWIFGHDHGDALRRWATERGWPLVWALGPEQCYEQVNQTGGHCGETGWSPSLGQDDPVYRANQRLLDPSIGARFTNTSINTAGGAAAAAAAFDEAWSAAQLAREHGRWNASAAWRDLVSKLPAALRLAPVSAGRCGRGGASSIMGASADGDCVLVTA